MERPIDFVRDRRMLCGHCDLVWTVDLEWMERWDRKGEACPGCGTTCDAEDAARVTVSENDPVLEDDTARRAAWYHSSTYVVWPPTIDFPAGLSDNVRMMMGGDEAVARWAQRQSVKALHVGTYESAVQNMLRRICDQGGRGEQFFLHRVNLTSDAVVLPSWLPEQSNLVGDVDFDEICSPDVEVVRYVNYFEDVGGVSLAIRPSAIRATQCLPIPLPVGDLDMPWALEVAERLATAPPDPPVPPEYERHRHLLGGSPRAELAAAAVATLSARLPVNLRWQFESAVGWEADADPTGWVSFAQGVAALVEDPARVVTVLDSQPVREH